MAEQHSTHRCDVCGNEFNRQLNADGSTRKTKYNRCSVSCKNRAKRLKKNQNAKKFVFTPPPVCTCRWCGVEYLNKRHRSGEGFTYCSRECAFSHQKEIAAQMAAFRAAEAERNRLARCDERNILIRAMVSGLKKIRASRKVEYATRVNRQALASSPCKICGDPVGRYTMGRPRLYCAACLPQAKIETRRRLRKIYGSTHRKRAKRYGVEYEPVNKIKVFARDGWRCQICGKPTPRNKMGRPVSNAPELDHRIPLSRGGSHTYNNTQCSCRECNGAKGNARETGQLPMFAA